MPRPKRLCVPGLPHHVVQRGNNRNATFYQSEDCFTYLTFLDEAVQRHGVKVHAYVLMTNHVHLLLTPSDSDGLSLAMQTLGRRYVTYINKTYQRTGTLWEGRFKSSIVDRETYCLACYRYIELNPVRAAMVASPTDYQWSSYHTNGLGRADTLLTSHSCYLQLGNTRIERATQYRKLINEGLGPEVVRQIRYGARKGLPVGCSRFKADIEEHLGRRLSSGRIGRPTTE
ncbi:MAG: transposase [Gammaproteobacteria bacterium]|nr:transposase [Gammaproteobacteria bacterium]